MVAEQHEDPEDQPSQFGELFAKPSIESMYALGADGLEAFVHYVFECAGYTAEHVGKEHYPHGPGVDLNLYHGPLGTNPVLRVEVRCYMPGPSGHPIDADAVMAFIGKLKLAGGVPGVMITTSDYTGPAYVAGAQGNVALINGVRLQRYIAYVRGSRLTGTHAPLAKAHKLTPLSPSCILEADSTPRLNPQTTTVLAIANNKGGVAKTTTAVILAQLLADKHKRNVLVVDMDGQASLTGALPGPGPNPPAPPTEDTVDLSDFFAGRRTFVSLIRKSRFPRLWVVPANERLLILDSGGAGRPEEELRFARAIHDPDLCAPDGSVFDWIILDTPPAQSFYTRAALAASHYVLCPANADAWALRAIRRTVTTARTMRALVGRGVEIVGFAVTRWASSAESNRALADLTDQAKLDGTGVLATKIPADFRVGRLGERVQGGFMAFLWPAHGDGSAAASAYAALLKEVTAYAHRD